MELVTGHLFHQERLTTLAVGATGLEPVTPLLVRNKQGPGYIGFAGPRPVFITF